MALVLVAATANPHKLEEIALIFGDTVTLLPRPASVPDVVEDADTLEGNARLKAVAICAATGQPAAAMVQDKALSSARPSTARPARGGGHGASGAATSTSFSMYAGQGHAQPPAHPGRGGQRLKSAESGRLDAAAAESARKVLRQPAVQAAIAQAMAELLGEHAGGGAGAAADTP